jgi:ubiquinone/menaquinone biosynthesis C-methylase UbiE
MKILPEFYDKAALDKSVEHFIDTYYFPKEEYYKRRVELVLKYLQPLPGERILDVGCGVGTFAFHSARAGAKAIGLDYSRESINIARKMTERFGVGESTRFITGTIDDLPFEDKYFDKIVASDIIEHISHEEKDVMLKEMKRVLKDDGIIVVYTPNGLRDKLGLIWKKLTFQRISKWDVEAHFGLISRRRYEKIISKNGLDFKFKYTDIGRPYLTSLPLVKGMLSLNLLWAIKKLKTRK